MGINHRVRHASIARRERVARIAKGVLIGFMVGEAIPVTIGLLGSLISLL